MSVHYGFIQHAPGCLVDPWMTQDPSACPPSECRTIAVTPEMRARDAAEREAREGLGGHPWQAVKAGLSMENLKTQPRRAFVRPAEPAPVVEASEKIEEEVPMAANETELCRHGCGKSRHRGTCSALVAARAAQKAAAEPEVQAGVEETSEIDVVVTRRAPIALPPPEVKPKAVAPVARNGGIALDTLKSKRVSLAEIPQEAEPPRKTGGRLGAIWDELQALPEGEALLVENRTREHATYTVRNVRERAEKAGCKLLSRLAGTDLYLWFAPKEEVSDVA